MKKLNMKKIQIYLNIMLMVILAVMVVTSFVSPVFALEPSGVTAEGQQVASDNITNLGKGLVAILQTTGIVLSVVILIVIGIKYMMGSPEEKSQYKSSMLPYIIGAALIFAASVVAQIVYDFFTGL